MDSPFLQDRKEIADSVESGQTYVEVIEELQRQRRRTQRRRRRVFHFITLLCLFCIWIVGRRVFEGKPIFNSSTYHECGGQNLNTLDLDHHHDVSIPPGITLGECTDWGRTPNDGSLTNVGHSPSGEVHEESSAFAEFPLSLESDLYLASSGSFSVGLLKVVQSDNVSPDAKAKVEIRYPTHHERYLDVAKVCKISRVNKDGKESTGVGVFTPRWEGRHHPHGHSHPYFIVTLELPLAKAEGDEALQISSFETEMPIFQHLISGLKTTSFGNLTLRTANALVDVSDVWAEKILVQTVNQAIRGTYRTWASLDLKTANGPIDVILELQNRDSSVATTANLVTTNGPISADTILSTTESKAGGNFTVDASTVNGKAALSFSSAPVNSVLNTKVVTALGPIHVNLHPTYEGTFALNTALSRAQVEDAGKDDPEGRGRKRVVDLDKVSANKLNGAVYWDEERKNAGSVVLESSLAPVTLSV